MYLSSLLTKYKYCLTNFDRNELTFLKNKLIEWANGYLNEIAISGSIAKGTSIRGSSDVDFLISIQNEIYDRSNLAEIYQNLYKYLSNQYTLVRKQNVSIRVKLSCIEVDCTPGVRHGGNTNYHSLYISKMNTWQQTNIQKHINDIKNSGRTNEIKLLKLWRQQSGIDFPSIYLEYLLIDEILNNREKSMSESILNRNMSHVFTELAKDISNPLFKRIQDPANTSNILSDLIDKKEKLHIRKMAKLVLTKNMWNEVIT